MQTVKLVECPRDAMQGWPHIIKTADKAAYLNQLLKVGFDVLDFGSFVSPKIIPQMADTKEVLPQLQLNRDSAKLLAIVANTRGASEACAYDEITYLGFPFSISETFQLRNTNKTIAQSLKEVAEIQDLCLRHRKKLLIYISMGFGNPYGDEYSVDLMFEWFRKLAGMGVEVISLADTVGVANPQTIELAFSNLIPEFPDIEIGGHFHSTATAWKEKIEAAFMHGCTHFDSSLKGIGGCPMAKDELVGNIATENLVCWLQQKDVPLTLDMDALAEATEMAARIFI